MSPKRNGMAEAPDESTPSTLAVVHAPPTFQDVILDKVIAKLDLPGLAHSVADEVATKLAGQVRVEMLIEHIMQQEGQALTNSLVERLLERMALTI